MIREINFDGIIGPSHNYAGLSHGNLAATRNAGATAYPRRAALEGVAKMRAVSTSIAAPPWLRIVRSPVAAR